MRWMVRGDIDGFFGLALDNLVQLLLIDVLCRTVLGFPNELIYGRVLPGAVVSLVVGNLFYSWQAVRLGRATGRTDVLLTYFGRGRFRGGLPGGLVAVALGTLLAWLTGVAPVGAAPQTWAPQTIAWHPSPRLCWNLEVDRSFS